MLCIFFVLCAYMVFPVPQAVFSGLFRPPCLIGLKSSHGNYEFVGVLLLMTFNVLTFLERKTEGKKIAFFLAPNNNMFTLLETIVSKGELLPCKTVFHTLYFFENSTWVSSYTDPSWRNISTAFCNTGAKIFCHSSVNKKKLFTPKLITILQNAIY